MAKKCKMYYYNSMETHIYILLAMIGRYILILVCFLIFVAALLEIRKAAQSKKPLNPASLKWNRGKAIFDLRHESIIGRSKKCNIVINSPFVKRYHLRILEDCGEWVIIPYKDTKVYLNKQFIDDRTLLTDKDVISFGKESMVFMLSTEMEEAQNV
ncbi:MAG: FHA domain-containing protein [Clostridia bacterium]|nr:FHA domain-containing protein [Clostridia bacterium]